MVSQRFRSSEAQDWRDKLAEVEAARRAKSPRGTGGVRNLMITIEG